MRSSYALGAAQNLSKSAAVTHPTEPNVIILKLVLSFYWSIQEGGRLVQYQHRADRRHRFAHYLRR